MNITRALVVSLLVALAAPAGADVWDTQQDSDNTLGTDNELIHGSMQVHDLGALSGPTAADQDWYLLSQKPFSSYEIVIDETSGDISGARGRCSSASPSTERRSCRIRRRSTRDWHSPGRSASGTPPPTRSTTSTSR